MRTLAHRLVYPLVASLVAAAGCDPTTDPVFTADFTRATPLQRTVAVMVAGGEGIAGAVSVTARIGWDSEGICPKVTKVGDKTILEGGCTRNEIRYEGGATISGEEDGLQEVTWDHFAIIERTQALRVDGVASVDERGDGTMEIAANVTLEQDGASVHFDGVLERDAARTWRASPGAFISIPDIGSADIEGAWDISHEGHKGNLELRGANTLAVDFARVSPGGCYATTIDGAATDPVCFGE
jgi:hypothetical protein